MNKDTTQIFMTELDTYLFGQGTHYEIYNKMGAHLAVKNGKEGVYFVVWAPKAKEVYVVGDFNDWRAYGYDMKPVSDGGVYELFVEGAKAGQCYKFLIISQDGEALYKADPYANAAQLRPETASVISGLRIRKKKIIFLVQCRYMNVILVHGESRKMEQKTDI